MFDTASLPNLLRLLILPFFAYIAYRDIKTRRVPNKFWLPLGLLAIILLGWELYAVSSGIIDPMTDPQFYPFTAEEFYIQVAISIGFLVPLSYLFWRMGGFGGADAKAFMVIAILLPVYPLYEVGALAEAFVVLPGVDHTGGVLPAVQTTLGVFSVTVLSNTVLVGLLYPVALAGKNAASGYLSPGMFVAKPIQWHEATDEYGTLLQFSDRPLTADLSLSGLRSYFSWRQLDLDALRMYLQWRGATLEELRENPEQYRNPASLPDEPNHPGDGAIVSHETALTDGGRSDDDRVSRSDDDRVSRSNDERVSRSDDERVGGIAGDGDDTARPPAAEMDDSADSDGEDPGYDDPWGAEAFLDDIEGSAYGTSPESLREGLETLTEDDVVWISPGIPFIVPMFLGLLVAFTYGDILFAILDGLGLVA